eukprot:scaffold6120_cov109-Isochrysis_galbana.AAC.8
MPHMPMLGGGMVILVLNKNTQTNTLALRGDREECIGTCLSLGSGPMTGRLTTPDTSSDFFIQSRSRHT